MKENMKKYNYLKNMLIVLITLIIGVIGTIITIHYFPVFKNLGSTDVNGNKNVNIEMKDSLKESIAKIYDSVVYVENIKNNQSMGSGTGFVYKKDDKYGYIITNHHVIADGDMAKVTFIDDNEVDAVVLGSDEYADVAVLRVDVKHVLQVAIIGESTKSDLGDTLFTVGSPLGKEYMGTVTKGVLSGKDREVTTKVNNGSFIMEVLQTDAAINPGNSGGPLVNINGEVIGVNSLKLVQDTIEGMGFAIPIEVVMSFVDSLEQGKEIERPLLGVSLIESTNKYGLYLNDIMLPKDSPEGLVVISVEKGFPAEKIGLKKGDIILEFGGNKTTSMASLTFVLYKQKMGAEVPIKISRDGKILDYKIKLDKKAE